MQQPDPLPDLQSEHATLGFRSEAEAEATYLVIAWFAVTEAAALGIFPILAALNLTRQQDPALFKRFFEPGFRHFRDEQHHANLWGRALLDFTEKYPQVVQRVALPNWHLKTMLRSIGKPHSLANFAVDCLAFETVLRAFYEVALPRLQYPALQPIFSRIIADEQRHTEFGQTYIFEVAGSLSARERRRLGRRYWYSLAGVIITLRPLLDALNRHKALPFKEFTTILAGYVRETDLPGCQRLLPNLLTRWG